MKLKELIWSLTVGEKRLFNFLNTKKGNTSASKPLKLFHVVDNNRFSGREIEKSDLLPIEDLSRTKYRLNQLIEQTLVFHSSGIFKFQPDTLDFLRLSHVYYQKNLYDKCLKTINKGLLLAKEDEDFSSMLSFLEVLEKLIYRKPSAIHQTFENQIKLILSERKSTQLKIERINQLKELYFDISMILLQPKDKNRKQPQHQKKKEIGDKIESINTDFLSVKEQFVYLKILQTNYLVVEDVKNCLKVTRNILDFMEQNLKRNYFLIEDYLITYQNLIVAKLNLGDLANLDQLIHKLSRFKISSKNKPLLKLQETVVCLSEIRYAYKKMEYNKALSSISKLKSKNITGFIHTKNSLEIKFMEIFSNFILRKYTTSDNLIRIYLTNIPKKYIGIDRAGVLILNILVNWELGIKELIPSICDASRYYFKRIKSYEESDRIILSWLKSNLSIRMKPPDFKVKLEELQRNLSKHKLVCSSKFQQIHFSSWIESKLNEIHLLDLLKEEESK